MPLSKPAPPAVYNPAHPLGSNPRAIVGLLAPSAPTDDVDGSACVYTADRGGTTLPTVVTDADGPGLVFDGPVETLGTQKELHAPGKGATTATIGNGVTVYAAFKCPFSNYASIPIMARSDGDAGLGFTRHNNRNIYPILSGLVVSASPLVVPDDQAVIVAVTFAQVGPDTVVTTYMLNVSTGVTSTPSADTLAGVSLADYVTSIPNDVVVNCRQGGVYCHRGTIYGAGAASEVFTPAKITALFADMWAAIRAPAGAFTPMIGSPFLRSC